MSLSTEFRNSSENHAQNGTCRGSHAPLRHDDRFENIPSSSTPAGYNGTGFLCRPYDFFGCGRANGNRENIQACSERPHSSLSRVQDRSRRGLPLKSRIVYDSIFINRNTTLMWTTGHLQHLKTAAGTELSSLSQYVPPRCFAVYITALPTSFILGVPFSFLLSSPLVISPMPSVRLALYVDPAPPL